jgi:hypothetical protein
VVAHVGVHVGQRKHPCPASTTDPENSDSFVAPEGGLTPKQRSKAARRPHVHALNCERSFQSPVPVMPVRQSCQFASHAQGKSAKESQPRSRKAAARLYEAVAASVAHGGGVARRWRRTTGGGVQASIPTGSHGMRDGDKDHEQARCRHNGDGGGAEVRQHRLAAGSGPGQNGSAFRLEMAASEMQLRYSACDPTLVSMVVLTLVAQGECPCSSPQHMLSAAIGPSHQEPVGSPHQLQPRSIGANWCSM